MEELTEKQERAIRKLQEGQREDVTPDERRKLLERIVRVPKSAVEAQEKEKRLGKR